MYVRERYKRERERENGLSQNKHPSQYLGTKFSPVYNSTQAGLYVAPSKQSNAANSQLISINIEMEDSHESACTSLFTTGSLATKVTQKGKYYFTFRKKSPMP